VFEVPGAIAAVPRRNLAMVYGGFLAEARGRGYGQEATARKAQ
jgi:hypothetical protein